MEDKEKAPEATVETPVTEDLDSINKEIEELKKFKQEQDIIAKKAELEALRAEVAKYKFPEEKKAEMPKLIETPKDPYQAVKDKFAELDYAIENFSVGHPARKSISIDDEFMGQPLLYSYWRYTNGEKIEDIFRNPLQLSVK